MWQTGIVKRIEQATHNTRRYWIELPETPVFHYKAGQFVTLDLPIHERSNKRWRSYSMASMPGEDNIIELVISYLPGGLASDYIFNHIEEGSTFTLRGPQGVFILPENMSRDIYMICTGTGIAPFRSMLLYIAHDRIPHQQLHLIFGTRTQKDLLYANEMRELENSLEGFHYHPVLSREDWEGHKGYVHSIYEALAAEKQPVHFMLCGWRPMIDEARERIVKMGYDKKDIHLELYG